MHSGAENRDLAKAGGTRRALRALRRDERGATAVEMGFVLGPFLMLLFGIISVGFYYFTTFMLENAVEEAARLIKTGQAQTGSWTTNPAHPPMTAAEFKTSVCNKLPTFSDCNSKARVHVKSFSDFGNITYPSCLLNEGAANESLKTDAQMYADLGMGGASTVVLVTVCYEWDLAGKIPFLQLGSMKNGSALVEVRTAFKSEPYQ